ncbi:MAG: SPFH/Band 7/PHB domain protein [Candidatus Altiarchaeota archaeon]|nr:SPFH/Band 7/PHB domain protein [Candidatus Altiarchaeota archaeon]
MVFLWIVSGLIALVVLAFFSIRIIPPTHRGLVERLGKYDRFAEPGLNLLIPFIESMRTVNITEQMVEAEPQEIITQDNLNAQVDAQVYFKVKLDEGSVKKSQYSVNDYYVQIVALARTTLRDIIGKLSFREVNSQREKLNSKLAQELGGQTDAWGIEVVRTELKEIQPPEDVQETMNKVLKAENERIAAKDFATARETEADGVKRARIKEAEGVKQFKILEAQGEAEAIRLVNDAARKYFVGSAQLLKKLTVTEAALKDNAKVIVPSGSSLVNLIGNLSGIVPEKKAAEEQPIKGGIEEIVSSMKAKSTTAKKKEEKDYETEFIEETNASLKEEETGG